MVTTDAVCCVITRWVIVLILLQRLKNAFRHVQSIRNKSPLGKYRELFFSFLIFMFLMQCSRSTNSLKDWWPLKSPKHFQWGCWLHEITTLESDFFRSHENTYMFLKILSILWDYEVSIEYIFFFSPSFHSSIHQQIYCALTIFQVPFHIVRLWAQIGCSSYPS